MLIGWTLKNNKNCFLIERMEPQIARISKSLYLLKKTSKYIENLTTILKQKLLDTCLYNFD